MVAERALPRCAGAWPSARPAARGRRRRRRSGCGRRRPAGRSEWAARPATTWPTTSAGVDGQRERPGGPCGSPARRSRQSAVIRSPTRARPGRSPRPTWRAIGLDERQVVGVGDPDAPAARPAAPGTARRAGRPAPSRPGAADDLGQQHLGLLGGVARPRPWPRASTAGMLGAEPPQVHRDQRVAVELRRATRRPWPRTARRRGADLAPLVDRAQRPVGVDLADAAGDRRVADDGLAQPEADQGVGRPLGQPRCAGQQPQAGARRRGRRRWPRRRARRRRAGRRPPARRATVPSGGLLLGEADVDRAGPAPLHVVADGRPGGRARRPGRSVENPAARASLASRSMTASPPGPDRRQRLAAAVAAGPAGRQDDQRRSRSWPRSSPPA